jgi:hypothetical protein
VLGGLVLLALLLFGGALVRLNDTINRGAVTAVRALCDWKVRSRHAQPDQ